MKTDSPSVVVAEHPCAVCGARLDAMHVDQGLEGTAICTFCGAPQNGHNGTSPGSLNDLAPPSLIETSELLREARERRGESLDQVAAATGIRETYLEELEAGGATFEPYPGRVYGRFFLREYAEHLGLEPTPLVEAFDVETRSDGPLLRDDVQVIRPRRVPLATVLAVVCLLAIVAARAVLPRGDGGDVEPISTPFAAASSLGHVGAPHAPPGHGRADAVRAVATVVGASWIQAISDGETIYQQTAASGVVLRFRADRRLELTFGNAGGVSLQVNGGSERTGPSGEVVHLAFELRQGAVTAVPA